LGGRFSSSFSIISRALSQRKTALVVKRTTQRRLERPKGLPVALFCSSLFSLNNIPSRKVFFFKGALKRNFNLAQQTKMKEIFSLKEEKKL
jgi:hypothetical protein